MIEMLLQTNKFNQARQMIQLSGSDVPKELAQDQDKARWENVPNVEIAQSRGNEDVGLGLTNDLTDGESVGAKAEAEPMFAIEHLFLLFT